LNTLYYENQYIKEFNAKILKKEISDNKIKIILDKTAFFPGGGGQSYDTGYINNSKVLEVYEEDNSIVHIIEEDINETEVYCKIDWDRRKDGMEQHLGQHILSGSFYKLLGRNTVSIHLGKDISTVDIIGELTEEEIIKVNNYANYIIEDNREVRGYFPENDDLDNIKLRRDLPITDKDIRILEIEGLDITACCGVHLGNTLEVRLIKIKKFEKNKGNTRIYFLAGSRAIYDSLDRERILKNIEKSLSTTGIETINSINNFKLEIETLKKKNKNIEGELINFELQDILLNKKTFKDINYFYKSFINKEESFIRNLVNKIVKEENNIIILINEVNNNLKIILASSKNIKEINLLEITKKHMDIIQGKGGGSSNRVEIMGDKKYIEEFILKIEDEIKNKKTN